MKLAGVVVTYNRKHDLSKNIESIRRQTKKLDCYYIIDNHSTDHTQDFIAQNFSDMENIKYVYLKDNTGCAGGFYEGIKRAYNDGYDLICLMDDDGRPANEDTISILYDTACRCYKKNPLLFLNALVVGDSETGELSFGLDKFKKRDDVVRRAKSGLFKKFVNPFNGTVISKELVSKIGYPNKELFIRGEEVDYNRRAEKAGAFVATIVESIYYHPKTEVNYFHLFGKECMMGVVNSPWKMYYLTRNRIYVLKREKQYSRIIKYMAVLFVSILRFDKYKRKSTKMMLKGFADALTGKLGKRVLPGTI